MAGRVVKGVLKNFLQNSVVMAYACMHLYMQLPHATYKDVRLAKPKKGSAGRVETAISVSSLLTKKHGIGQANTKRISKKGRLELKCMDVTHCAYHKPLR